MHGGLRFAVVRSFVGHSVEEPFPFLVFVVLKGFVLANVQSTLNGEAQDWSEQRRLVGIICLSVPLLILCFSRTSSA